MMYKLIQRYVDGVLQYKWIDANGAPHGDNLITVEDAEIYFEKFLIEKPDVECRTRDFDRRWMHDRRKRVSMSDRRQNPIGRRWTDYVAHERKK